MEEEEEEGDNGNTDPTVAKNNLYNGLRAYDRVNIIFMPFP
jgi:hypothetical protein